MKLPDVFTGLLSKNEDTKEYFFSLYVDRDSAAVAVWHLNEHDTPHVGSFAHAVIAEDTWESRSAVIDRLLSAAEEKVHVSKPITKTVFGVPGVYLTAHGDISDVIRPHLKKLSNALELQPVGFVPLSQAIAFQLKQSEGVPPSVILVGCSGLTAHVTVFRVGNEVSDDTIDLGEDPVTSLESVLKKHQDGDVLPSRILLYGGNISVLEDVKSKLLKHPWPSRANFIHFPKIEIIDVESLLSSVSLAGASELQSHEHESKDASFIATAVAQAGSPDTEEAEETEETEDTNDIEEPTDIEETEEVEEVEDVEEVEEDEDDTDISNVQMVSPESLGFQQKDILEQPPEPIRQKKPFSFSFPTISRGAIMHASASFFRNIPTLRSGMLPVISIVLVLLVGGIFVVYGVPRAVVTVMVSSKTINETASLVVDPKSTLHDTENKKIPGITREQTVNGEKTIAVSGKKNVGDAARGSVTIYNKVTSSKMLSKGTLFTTGSVVFTLDSDTLVASASESIGSITFGKTTAAITARDIGPNGNSAAGSEITIANFPSSQISARNETAFTGGTSRQVTVVSRADQDALVKALTDDLVTQAKQQLLSASSTGERLIEQTIKTQVTEKVFSQELDEEAGELHGKVTVKISGIAISDADVKAVLSELVRAKIPTGYTVASEQTNVTVSNVSLKKDGTITLQATLSSVALPGIDVESIAANIAGTHVSRATELLRQTEGVAGAEYRVLYSPFQTRLPYNKKNITITIMVQ